MPLALRQGRRAIRHRPARAEPDPPHRRRARTVCAGELRRLPANPRREQRDVPVQRKPGASAPRRSFRRPVRVLRADRAVRAQRPGRTASAPSPSCSSEMTRPLTPVSERRCQSFLPGSVSPSFHERMTAGMSDLVSSASMLAAKSWWEESSANLIGPPSVGPSRRLSDDVFLNLVGACVDRAGQGEQVSVHPVVGQLASGP